MKRDILYYILLIVSIAIFICTYVFLEPIPIVGEHEEQGEFDEITIEPIYDIGLENRDLVEKKYTGELELSNKWGNYVFIFTDYKNEFIEQYEKYNDLEESDEKADYERTVYLRYGIDDEKERENLYKSFKGTSNIIKISVIKDTIVNLENGISFDILAKDDKESEYLYNVTIFNEYIPYGRYHKLLPKLISSEEN